MSTIRLSKFLSSTRVEGPGTRACLWVQGCSIQCPGCAVPWTWPEQGGTEYLVDELAERILGGPEIEGVTFMGGEPFDQAAALASLAEHIRGADLSVVTFSGYEFDTIEQSKDAGWRSLAAATDLLIAGPYLRERASLSSPWVGSSNQTYHFLTARYAHLEDRLHEFQNGIEIRIRPDGQVFVNGMADMEELYGLARVLDPVARQSAETGRERDLSLVSGEG